MSADSEALALAVRPCRVRVTNIRFGFVDTKMAKGPFRRFLRSTCALSRARRFA